MTGRTQHTQPTGSGAQITAGIGAVACYLWPVASACAAALLLWSPMAIAGTFADAVVSYAPGPGIFVNNPLYNDPSRCLGAPHGLYVDEPDNSSLATLGDGGSITVSFVEPVIDDPRNPYGLDFIVFSNAQFVGGDPGYRWQELAFVEISQDANDWYLILPSKWPRDLVGGTDTGQSRTVVSGYAEYTPTVGLPQDLALPPFPVSRTPEELYTVPERPSIPGAPAAIAFDYVSGGGDAMDIADAVVQTSPGVPALDGMGQPVRAGIDWFRYIRITDAVVGDSWPGLGECSAEIDAVSRVRRSVTVGDAKRQSEGTCVLIADAMVTGVFADSFFVESSDRSAGLKVISNSPVSPGDRVTVTGHISNAGGRGVLPDPMFTVTASDQPLPRPLGMPVGSLAEPMAYGLRVRTWGRVTHAGDGYRCVISDGDGEAAVVCAEPFQVTLGAYVSVTGICDREEVTGSTLIVLSNANDIATVGD